ncbi:MAG TPA: PQQ-binding-like beta-propeller repeat protein [Chitinophagaceae bacterium]|nr:PQQ-binding-like beta-propeller repeat protein [Chitinophagaceae bacterium]
MKKVIHSQIFISLLAFFFIVMFSCKKKDTTPPPVPSSEKVILSFNFNAADNAGILFANVTGSIGADTIKLIVLAETGITNLKPAITFNGKSISPLSGVARNFSSPVTYTVTAENGSTKTYVIDVKYKNTVFISSLNGTMYALDGNTGAEIWKLANGQFHSGSPAVKNGSVYICGLDGLYSLDARTGLQNWKFPVSTVFPLTFLPGPVTDNNTVYFDGWDGFVYAINSSNGTLKWKTQSTGLKAFSSNVTLNNNLLYTGCLDSSLYALSVSTGAISWKFKTGDAIYQNPLVVNGNVFTTGLNGNQYLLNGTTGTIIWSIPGDFNVSSPTYANGLIYTGGGVRAFGYDIATGTRLWLMNNSPVFYTERSSPVILNGKFYAGSNNGNVYGYTISNSVQIWSITTDNGSYVYSSPVIADGILYIGDAANTIYAINADAGTIKWKKQSASAIASACVIDQQGIKHYPGISGEQN